MLKVSRIAARQAELWSTSINSIQHFVLHDWQACTGFSRFSTNMGFPPSHSARRPTLRHDGPNLVPATDVKRLRPYDHIDLRCRQRQTNKQTKTHLRHIVQNGVRGVLQVLVVFMKNNVSVLPSGQTLILDPPRLTHKGHLNACRLLHGCSDDCADETVAGGSFRLNKLKHWGLLINAHLAARCTSGRAAGQTRPRPFETTAFHQTVTKALYRCTDG